MVEFEHKSGCQSHGSPIITKKRKGSLLGRVGKRGVGVRVGVQKGEEGEGRPVWEALLFPLAVCGCMRWKDEA